MGGERGMGRGKSEMGERRGRRGRKTRTRCRDADADADGEETEMGNGKWEMRKWENEDGFCTVRRIRTVQYRKVMSCR